MNKRQKLKTLRATLRELEANCERLSREAEERRLAVLAASEIAEQSRLELFHEMHRRWDVLEQIKALEAK